MKNLAYIVASVLISLLLIEGFFYVFPRLLPLDVLMSLSHRRIDLAFGNDPSLLVERLPHSPWLKFRPGVVVHDGVHPGEVSSFQSEWKTDLNGFKNTPSQSLDTAQVIILGNSHLEGIGVRPQDTLAAALTRDYGTRAYSLGVEGYGPSQMVDAFTTWGRGPSVRFGIFAFNGSLQFGAAEDGRNNGGRINQRAAVEARGTNDLMLNNSVVLAFMRVSYIRIRQTIRDLQSPTTFAIPAGDVASRADALAFIKAQIETALATQMPEHDPDTDPDMNATEQSILKFANDAQTCGIVPVILIMPTFRYTSELVFPGPQFSAWKSSLVGVEYASNAHVKTFAEKFGIPVIDTTGTIVDQLKNWAKGDQNGKIDFRNAAFFKVDGHPTAIAHHLYAAAVAAFVHRFNGEQTRKPCS